MRLLEIVLRRQWDPYFFVKDGISKHFYDISFLSNVRLNWVFKESYSIKVKKNAQKNKDDLAKS